MSKPQCGKSSSDGAEKVVCPVVTASRILRSMWSLIVISYLQRGPQGFNELLRVIPGINSKTLARTLKSLQASGLVTREVVNTQPFAVKYSLTEMAHDLGPVLNHLRSWGEKWVMRRGEEGAGLGPVGGRASRILEGSFKGNMRKFEETL